MGMISWLFIICMISSWGIFIRWNSLKWSHRRIEYKLRRFFEKEGYVCKKEEGQLCFYLQDIRYRIHMTKGELTTAVIVSVCYQMEDMNVLNPVLKCKLSQNINEKFYFSKIHISDDAFAITTLWDINTKLQTSFSQIMNRINNIGCEITKLINIINEIEKDKNNYIQEEKIPQEYNIVGEC